MLFLQIKKLVSYQPQPLPPNAKSWMDGGSRASLFAGDHPSNPQTGTVTLDVELLDGSFDNIKELRFIIDESPSAKLIHVESKGPNDYRIEVEFETVYLHGLEYMASQLIPENGGILGMTTKESHGLISLEEQKKLLYILTNAILPERAEAILELARPAVYLVPMEEKTSFESHLTGEPQLPMDVTMPKDNKGRPLFHLGTLKINELPLELNFSHFKSWLSFYLSTHLDGPWPLRKDDIAVMTYDDETIVESNDSAFDQPVYFDIKPVLEVPPYSHSLIHQMQLEEAETDSYEALESTYRALLDPMYDFHTYSKIGGYPDNLQICVAYEAELIRNNNQYGEETMRSAVQWQLLFQLVPEHHHFTFTETFGDGYIYYMIKAEELERGDLSDVQVVIQNT